jgi:hypothetical protein
MKKVFLGLGLVVIGAGLFGLGWISHGEAGNASTPNPSGNAPVTSAALGNPAANTPAQAPHPAAFVSPSEFQQLRAARDAVLQANPDLAGEYKQIITDMQAQQDKFDAAMIKADPKVAPIVAKLVALRQINSAHVSSGAPASR